MKRQFLSQLFLFGVLASPLVGGEVRSFATVDGSKVINASITKILPDKDGKRFIEITREDNGRRYNVLAEIFSEEDQSYIEEAVVLFRAGRNLSVSIEPNEERSSPSKTGGRSIVTATHTFDLQIRNNGEEELKGLEIEYRVFYQKAERIWETKGTQRIGKSKRNDSYKEDRFKLASVKPREDKALATTPVNLTHDRPNRGGPG